MPEENETKVVNEPAAAVEPTTTPAVETVASPEVKTEVPAVEPVQNNTDSAKMQSQIDNLNTALKQEREAGKTSNQELADKLATSQETIDKLKTVFSPEQPEETTQDNLTIDQVKQLLDDRDTITKENTLKETQAQTIKKEIVELEG